MHDVVCSTVVQKQLARMSLSDNEVMVISHPFATETSESFHCLIVHKSICIVAG